MYPTLAVQFSSKGDKLFTAGLDNVIRQWDLRKLSVESILSAHSDSITGLSLSHDGSYLLSNAMDNTLRVWDIRPFAVGSRCVKIFTGHSHSYEKLMLRCGWAADGELVACGSADGIVNIWNTANNKLVHRLTGHNGSVIYIKLSWFTFIFI